MLINISNFFSTQQSIFLLIISFILPFILYYILKTAIDYFQINSLYDLPDNQRKNHKMPTLIIGGLVTFVFFIIYTLFDTYFYKGEFLSFFLFISFFFLVGFYDDISPIGGAIKLIITFIVSLFFFTVFQEFTINQILIDNRLTLNFDKLAILISSLFLVIFLFSLNLSDGRNGIFVSLIIVWLISNNYYLIGALSEFNFLLLIFLFIMLLFNLQNKFFFGDSGVYLLASYLFLISVVNLKQENIGFEQIILWYYLPVLDALRVGVLRFLKRKSMFDPGHEHFQYLISSFSKKEFVFYSLFVSAPIIIDFVYPDFTYLILLIAISLYSILILKIKK